MKKLHLVLTVGMLTITSCQPKKLDKKMAESMILEKNHYPKIIDYDVFRNDPVHAYTILKSGLVEKGYVKVLERKRIGDTASTVSFTAAAKPFLLPTPEEDKVVSHIQRVKIGEANFGGIKEISIMSSGNKAVVSYYTIQNKNVFAAVRKNPISDTIIHQSYFIREDSRWKIMDKKNELEFLAF